MNLQTGLFLYLVIIFSAIVHEYAHGWMANRLGDPTAKQMGRLTLNPLPHIDPIGTVVLPLFLMIFAGFFIGYARPVPFNPFYLRDPRRDVAKIAIAGPAANFLIAILFALLLAIFPLPVETKKGLAIFISSGNLSGALAAASLAGNVMFTIFVLINIVVLVNIWLGLFNLIPVPPLDGSKILMAILPQKQAISFGRALGPLGIFLALIIAFLILSPLASLIFRLLSGLSLGSFG